MINFLKDFGWARLKKDEDKMVFGHENQGVSDPHLRRTRFERYETLLKVEEIGDGLYSFLEFSKSEGIWQYRRIAVDSKIKKEIEISYARDRIGLIK